MDTWGQDERAQLEAQPPLPNWKLYRRSGMISEQDEANLHAFDRDLSSSRADRDSGFRQGGEQLADTFFTCFKYLNVPTTVWYLLYTLDQTLREDESRAVFFERALAANSRAVHEAAAAAATTEEDVSMRMRFEGYKPLLRLIPGTDDARDAESLHVRWRALSVLRVLLAGNGGGGGSPTELHREQQRQCIQDVLSSVARESLALPDELLPFEEAGGTGEWGDDDHGGGVDEARVVLLLRVRVLQASLELLQRLIQVPACRAHLLSLRGLETLTALPLLCPRPKTLLDAPVDVQYRSLFALWMLSYDEGVAGRLSWRAGHPMDCTITVHSTVGDPRKGLIREVVRLLRSSEKTRVVRARDCSSFAPTCLARSGRPRSGLGCA
jgi:hypothetical protein|eukprot:COSAG01_NODE_805_length_13443_cov_81.464928_14_plen_382_part_00